MNTKALVLVMCTAGCASVPPFDEQGIRDVLTDQEAAWDRGDIPAFMAGYGDSICFIGSKGRTCGKDEVTRNYQRSYPDQAAMGNLDFTLLELLPVGAEHAWATGYWRLKRASDTLNGGFSLLWQKQAEGWRIIRDHSY